MRLIRIPRILIISFQTNAHILCSSLWISVNIIFLWPRKFPEQNKTSQDGSRGTGSKSTPLAHRLLFWFYVWTEIFLNLQLKNDIRILRNLLIFISILKRILFSIQWYLFCYYWPILRRFIINLVRLIRMHKYQDFQLYAFKQRLISCVHPNGFLGTLSFYNLENLLNKMRSPKMGPVGRGPIRPPSS